IERLEQLHQRLESHVLARVRLDPRDIRGAHSNLGRKLRLTDSLLHSELRELHADPQGAKFLFHQLTGGGILHLLVVVLGPVRRLLHDWPLLFASRFKCRSTRASAVAMSWSGNLSVRLLNACSNTNVRSGSPKYSTRNRSRPNRIRSSRIFPRT